MNIISCSRRTDIPMHYSNWLEECLTSGQVTFSKPRVGINPVSLNPEDVHSLVLWSKNYDPLWRRRGLRRLLRQLNPFFHFTITGLGGSIWEPSVPEWPQAVATMSSLARSFGAERINWRFDPVVFWDEHGCSRSNVDLFTQICSRVASLGIATCTFSFAHWYAKSSRRSGKAGIEYIDPPPEEKISWSEKMVQIARASGISLSSCSNEALETVAGVSKAHCIDSGRLSALREDGLTASRAKDQGQRRDCGCVKSVDIGSYAQKCGQNHCAYCYAN